MVKAHESWPFPEHVAWPSLYLNGASTLLDPSLCGRSAYLNPALSAFPGFTAPATSSLQTDQTNEVRGFVQDPKTESRLKEGNNYGAMPSANPASLQKKFIIFDRSGNKTRLFYSPVFPLNQSPIDTTAQFAQAYEVNQDRRATSFGQKHLPKDSLPDESDHDQEDHVVNEESEMRENTEEINALLYSDDDEDDDEDDGVTSTDHSPLSNEMTHLIQKPFEDIKEDVASSDWPSKRHKLIDGGYARLPLTLNSASSVRLSEPSECVSDAESKYSGGQMYFSTKNSEDNNSAAGDIQLRKAKICESLKILENLTPGAKGKHPLLVIDETIDYLKSLMSQTGMLGGKISLNNKYE